MTSYLTSMDTISLSGTVFKIFDFKILGFDLDLWPVKVTWGQFFIPFESPYRTSSLTSIDTIILSRSVFEIFDFKFSGFDLDIWPLKVSWSQKTVYYSKAHIWLPISLLWTPSLYLVPFSRYSTSKILAFDFDLRPLKVIWGQIFVYHSKTHLWLPVWLLWTTSLYLVPLSRYSPSKFLGFDLDLWPPKIIWDRIFVHHLKAHIWLPIWLLWTPALYLVSFSRYSTSKFLGFDLNLWPLKVFWGQIISYHSNAHIRLPIWLLWTPSLYLVPFSRFRLQRF